MDAVFREPGNEMKQDAHETGRSYRRQRISSLTEPGIELYAALSEHQLKGYFAPREGLFVAESGKVISRALDAGYEPVSMLVEDGLFDSGRCAELCQRCADASGGAPGGMTVYTGALPVLEKLTGYRLTKGFLCAMRRKPLPSMIDLIGEARRIAVLENVMNPTNLGAIFRSAAALGIDAVLLSPSCADPLYRRAARVSMGTVFRIPWTWAAGEKEPSGWPRRSLQILKEHGFLTAALALREETVTIDDPALAGAEKIALLLGTEGEGLSKETISLCDYTVKIPMAEGVDSLNVAAAGAVAFWEIGRRRP